jgi:hypothetical protein
MTTIKSGLVVATLTPGAGFIFTAILPGSHCPLPFVAGAVIDSVFRVPELAGTRGKNRTPQSDAPRWGQ